MASEVAPSETRTFYNRTIAALNWTPSLVGSDGEWIGKMCVVRVQIPPSVFRFWEFSTISPNFDAEIRNSDEISPPDSPSDWKREKVSTRRND